MLFQLFFSSKDFDMLQSAAIANAGATEDEWKRFVAYVAGFYSNMGNYHAFGHSKFVPEMPKEKFFAILKSNPEYKEGTLYKEKLDQLLPLVGHELFSLEKPFASLGFPHEGGVTGYFSPSMTPEDLTLVRDFFSEKKLSPLNTRVFKIPQPDGTDLFEITVGSIEESSADHEFKG